MNQSLLLISYVESELVALRSKFQTMDQSYIVDVAHNLRQGYERVAKGTHQLIIMNFDSISEAALQTMRNMKSYADKKPLLALGRVEKPELIEAVTSLPQTIFLEKPFEEKDLSGLTSKILDARGVAQRIHRRFNTEQKAFIEIYGKNVESETTLFNMSRGGAYFELPAQPDIVVGDIVKLNVDLKELKHNYRIHAKVIWTTPKGISTGGYGVGVEFIRSNRLFQELSSR